MRTSMTMRRVGLATMATSLVLGGSALTAGTAYAEADVDFTRVSGDNRYATSAKAAEAFGATNTVILASGEQGRYPDALAANYLAGLQDAPVLLTKHNVTPDVVKSAIEDSGARNIILVGGESAISAEQEQALRQEYGNVKRFSGDDRYGTASEIIGQGGNAQDGTALLATGTNFPDALGGGPVAFAEDMPLAITKPGDMPDDVLAALKRAGVTKVLVLGGESAVSQAVVDELKKEGIEVTKRFNGSDRAETSALLARYAMDNFGFDDTAVNVASGYVKGDGADALGGAALTGKEQRALLITKTEDTAGAAILALLDELSDTVTEGRIFGGPSAVTQGLELAIEKAVLGSGAQIGTELYDTPQEAVDAAEAGDTVTLFGTDNPGFAVNKADVTVQGENGAAVTGAIRVAGVKGVTIKGLAITPSDVANQVAGIYLDNVSDVTIVDNNVVGEGQRQGAGAGVINTSGGDAEKATIRNNTFRNLTQGVFANDSASFVINDNTFRENVAGSANDAVSEISGNRFINNEEGVGLGVAGSTVLGNSFGDTAPNGWYVGDYTSDQKYDLQAIIDGNKFDNEVEVSADDRRIVDESPSANPAPSESASPNASQ